MGSVANTFWVVQVVLLFVLLGHSCAANVKPASPPNIIIILTDDLDLTLGGANASTLETTRRLIGEPGMMLPHWFVHTPVCCPSRAQLLTGKMFHNLRTKHDTTSTSTTPGCMHVDVNETSSSPFYARDYFAKYFAHPPELNYTIGVFGKHLNTNNPKGFIPEGVDQWLVNGGGTYLNPSFTWASKGTDPVPVTFDNCTLSTGMPCYSTSIIGNASLAWIQRHVQSSDPRPFFALISVKAPHLQDGPGFPLSIPAPWYENVSIPEQTAPRTMNYNQSCPDHHWLVRRQPPLTREEGIMVDKLYSSRLKTLLSVDDLVRELVSTLEEDLQVLENTIIVFTSDNGYRLGQFRMPQGKFHPYENDIRVPLMIRGPSIDRNVPLRIQERIMGTHVDLMPTLLGLALGNHSQTIIPSTMDGSNLAGIFEGEQSSPRRALLVEYMSLGNVVRYQHLEDTYNHTFLALRILDTVALQGARNLKYVEFRDSRNDWDCEKPPLEIELFDLDQDPFETTNIAAFVSPFLLQALSLKMSRMFRCSGQACRQEHANDFLFEYVELEAEATPFRT